MPFSDSEVSRASGQPVALFYFRYGSHADSFYAYTDAEQAVVAAGSIAGIDVTYSPIPIGRGAVTTSGSLDKAQLEIRMPRDIALTQHFVAFPPSLVVTLIIRQAHRNAPATPPALDAPVVWAGRVVGMAFEGSEAKFTCEPIATSMRRNGLRRNYQRGCPHALYDENTCRADKTVATVTVAITGTAANKIIMPAEWFEYIAVAKYLGGLAEWTTPEGNVEIRTILKNADGKDLVVDGLIRGLVADQNVAVSLGCNRQQDDCRDLHVSAVSGFRADSTLVTADSTVVTADGAGEPLLSNIHNFGGQPFIPFENPIGFNNQFY